MMYRPPLVKVFLLFIFFSFFSLSLFAAEEKLLSEKSRAEREMEIFRELVFESARYEKTGYTSIPECLALKNLAKYGSNLMLLRKYMPKAHISIYYCEYCFPEKLGIIDCSFSEENLYSISDSLDSSEENSPLNWVDSVLQNYNAPAAFSSGDSFSSSGVGDLNDGSKILEMLEGKDSRGIDEGISQEAELPKEFDYRSNDGSLRRFSYDGEEFTMDFQGDNLRLTNFYGDKLIRKTFDSLYRLKKSEEYKTSSSAKEVTSLSIVDYEYAGEFSIPSKSVEDMIAQKKRREKTFDQEGRVESLLESHYEEKEEKKSKNKSSNNLEGEKEKKEMILLNDKKTSYKYDDEGRVKEEVVTSWKYKINSLGRRVKSSRSIKSLYDYSKVKEGGITFPDLIFYEDGELHMARKYNSQNSYSEKLYFEGGFSVEVLYEAGVKKQEIIYLNDVEKRRRDFEY